MNLRNKSDKASESSKKVSVQKKRRKKRGINREGGAESRDCVGTEKVGGKGGPVLFTILI